VSPLIPPCLSKIIKVLEDKKAVDVQVLEMGEIVTYTDFIVVCSGTSSTHVTALVASIEDALGKEERPIYINSSKDDSWWILDFVEVVVHVFKENSRVFYDLEGLWNDAQRLQI
jgi:ribosome-associated protein